MWREGQATQVFLNANLNTSVMNPLCKPSINNTPQASPCQVVSLRTERPFTSPVALCEESLCKQIALPFQNIWPVIPVRRGKLAGEERGAGGEWQAAMGLSRRQAGFDLGERESWAGGLAMKGLECCLAQEPRCTVELLHTTMATKALHLPANSPQCHPYSCI
jgi:hypothetical protein